MTITIPKSKTDQSREGNVGYIAELETKYCAVVTTAMFIHRLGIQDNFLICKFVKTRNGHWAYGRYGLSYSRTRDVFLELAQPLFPDTSLGLHGLRAGDASLAAENNVSDRLISKLGRWSFERARDGY